jgi:molecular chaperone GrpE
MVKKNNSKKISGYEETINRFKAEATASEEKRLRTLADYQNLERRLKESQNQFIKYANATLLEKILLNVDSFEMAQSHLKDAGLEIVIKQLQETLKNEGLQLIESDNKQFDPLTMDCIEVVPGKKDHVIETLTKGYFLFGKVLRPAKVKVGTGAK